MPEGRHAPAIRKAIEVSGMVQGVGFRPYVYRLANECGLAGFIANTPAGVTIEVQGPADKVEAFLERLPREVPPMARITFLASRLIAANGERDFRILTTRLDRSPTALVSPDVAICADCLRELFDPGDRRYGYPFINCTNCGPRFTILREIPYDRARTSMAVFPMCPACQAEYDEPHNRRFHAQPNACWECGPRPELWGPSGERIAADDPIRAATDLLASGCVVAVKGLGGFHLACEATDASAVERLRERKRRVEKPFAIMAPQIESIAAFCEMDATSRALLLSPERPIVLLPWKTGSRIAAAVAPGQRYLGVLLPYTPLHHRLFAGRSFEALVMTSGNLSEEPIASDNQEVLQRLAGIADAFLVHNREIVRRCDDSVLRIAGGRPRQVRRSRGYVPAPLVLEAELPAVLAVGGELKNTVCLLRGNEAFLSQHIGDLENLESYKFFEEAVEHLQAILEVRPDILAHDLHPDYFSTRWALQQSGRERIGVQHHHAHAAACMAENHLDGRVIALVLDGTGYGPDGTIWGGEVLLATYEEFERAAHFRYVPMPGGAAAIREPWRMAVGCLIELFGARAFEKRIPFMERLDRAHVEMLQRMVQRGLNTPKTSSCGRLFDAVAALAGICRTVTYEAQAAMALEMCLEPVACPAAAEAGDAYPFGLQDASMPWKIDSQPMFEALLEDLERNTPVPIISRRFHDGLAEVLCQTALRLREHMGLRRVCLSGGCFQNAYLFEKLMVLLAAERFAVFTHAEVPAGDGGLSLGQAIVAARRASARSKDPGGQH
jgi:hydrogenase maturation protein HypF